MAQSQNTNLESDIDRLLAEIIIEKYPNGISDSELKEVYTKLKHRLMCAS